MFSLSVFPQMAGVVGGDNTPRRISGGTAWVWFPQSGERTMTAVPAAGVGTVTLTMPETQRDIGLLWGSADVYNALSYCRGMR